jgi:hypothetical protein
MCVFLAVVKCVNYLCLCAYCVNLLSALDSNEAGFSGVGEVFEYQEEDQGQADQGKPSKLVASLILVVLMRDLLLFTKMHGFIYCYCL